MAFPRNELIEFTLYMLEDQKHRIWNVSSILGVEPVIETQWNLYLSQQHSKIEISFSFGRDKYTLDQLHPYVHEAFVYLRCCHHNRVRRQMREKINTITGLQDLLMLLAQFKYTGYAPGLQLYILLRIGILHGLIHFNLPSADVYACFSHFLATLTNHLGKGVAKLFHLLVV
ncbi:hypothetical protein B0H19DRAFT_1060899 [Mycena capillaripes]|nr:hypothetical protein B0H19DRAFT_1060899 [Mycena capillaripes]